MKDIDILIIEDDKAIRRLLELAFEYEKYTFHCASDGRIGWELFNENSYKVVLMDLMLPHVNGLELCRKIRVESSVHIIMLTARRDVMDRVVGLDAGADDYITKPFEMEELLARVRSTIRRVDMDKSNSTQLKFDDLSINLLTREVIKQDEIIELTKKEYELLAYLAQNKGIVLTRNQIVDKIWGTYYEGDTNVLDVYIKYLRSKIDYPYGTKLIETVRGVGYIIKG